MTPMAKAFLLALERSDMFINYFSSGIEGAEWLARPAGASNPAIWIVGHLAYHRAVFLEVLTGRKTYDESWTDLFRMGCDAVDPADYPDIDTCRDFLAARFEDLKSWLEGATVEELESAPLVESDFFKTKAEVLVQLTHHEAHHTGGLSYVRRLLGKERLI